VRRIVLIVAGVSALACARETDQPQGNESAAASAPPAMSAPTPSVATVQIVAPAEGDSVGADVMVTLSSSGISIERASGTREEGKGHHHLFLDVPVSADTAPVPPNSATVVHLGAGDSTYTFKAVKPGPHTLIAVMAYGDHIPVTGAVRDTVHFVVRR
jgi:hypothetical protein